MEEWTHLNGGESSKQKGQIQVVFLRHCFLENADESDEEDDNGMTEGIPERKDKCQMNKHKIGNEGFATDLMILILRKN